MRPAGSSNSVPRMPKVVTERYIPLFAIAGLIVVGFLLGVSDPEVWGAKDTGTTAIPEDAGEAKRASTTAASGTKLVKRQVEDEPSKMPQGKENDVEVGEASTADMSPSPPRLVQSPQGGRNQYANDAANRSPPRLNEPLALESGGPKVDPTTYGCWIKNGHPTSVPSFLPGLLTAMGNRPASFEAMLAEANDDPWGILIGWIPSRFMPPQPKGKNARGEVMEAPTEGRDAKLYRERYNATWHSIVQADGKDWHFQLMHRNSIRVCIRERLHLYEIFCGPEGNDVTTKPLRIYYCPCRHCEKVTPRGLHRTKSRKEGGVIPTTLKTASLKAPSLALSGPDSPGGPKKTGSTCVSGRSAPWLVPRSQVPKFPFEGLSDPGQIDDLLKVQADKNNIVMVTFFNEFWIDHLHNWVYSLGTYGKAWNYIVATTDTKSLEMCKANRLPCFDATDYAEKKPEEKDGFGTKVTEAASWIKPRLAIAVLSRGFHFFMVDLDLTWNNAQGLHYILKTKSDISHQCDTPAKFSINSGYYLARSNDRTVTFFKNIMTFKPTENSDQTAMKLFMRYDTTHGASNECLDKWRFNMKCNFKVDKSVKRSSGVETFEWRQFDRDRSKFSWTIMHATCLSGAKNKILWLRTMNAWFLDELDDLTDPLSEKKSAGGDDDEGAGGGYCLLLDFPHLTGDEGASKFKTIKQPFSKATTTTKHSQFYSRNATSAIFLKSRH